MTELFSALNRAVEGSPLAALGAALVWGILSVILSPCHLASVPLIVGFVGGRREITIRRSFLTSLLFLAFGLGHCAVIAGAGTSATAVQRWLQWGGESQGMTVLRRVCGVLVIAGGLYFIWTAR